MNVLLRNKKIISTCFCSPLIMGNLKLFLLPLISHSEHCRHSCTLYNTLDLWLSISSLRFLMCFSSDALRVLGVRVVMRFRGPQNISIAFINTNHGASSLRFDVLPRVFLQTCTCLLDFVKKIPYFFLDTRLVFSGIKIFHSTKQ